MSLTRVGAREIARRTRGAYDWPCLLFAERFTTTHLPDGRDRLLNYSNPEVMADAASQVLVRLAVSGVVAAPPEDTTYVIDDDGQETSYDSRRDTPWWRDRAMADFLPPAHRAAVEALFASAGVRHGFYGGIVGRESDVPRVAKVLALYAYGMQENILLLCEDRPLLLLACHEGDLHLHSSTPAVLIRAGEAAQQLGLRLLPVGVELVRG